MDAPRCDLCTLDAGKVVRHWDREPHVFEADGKPLAGIISAFRALRDESSADMPWTPGRTKPVTEPTMAEVQRQKEATFTALVTKPVTKTPKPVTKIGDVTK